MGEKKKKIRKESHNTNNRLRKREIPKALSTKMNRPVDWRMETGQLFWWKYINIKDEETGRFPMRDAITYFFPPDWSLIYQKDYLLTTHQVSRNRCRDLSYFIDGLIFSGFFEQFEDDLVD